MPFIRLDLQGITTRPITLGWPHRGVNVPGLSRRQMLQAHGIYSRSTPVRRFKPHLGELIPGETIRTERGGSPLTQLHVINRAALQRTRHGTPTLADCAKMATVECVE